MKIEKAKDIYSTLLNTASKFLSPSLKQFFIRKANNDFHKIKGQSPEAIEKYFKEQKEANESLNRAVSIYNTYYDKSSTI